MKLEEQVTSLELSRTLKELGVKQKSLFQWSIEYKKKNGKSSTQLMGNSFGMKVFHNISWRVYDWNKRETYSAFTVAELGEMLPARITNPVTRNMDRLCFYLKEHKGVNSMQDMRDGYTIEYHTLYSAPLHRLWGNTEANARASMLIYLIENKLMEVLND